MTICDIGIVGDVMHTPSGGSVIVIIIIDLPLQTTYSKHSQRLCAAWQHVMAALSRSGAVSHLAHCAVFVINCFVWTVQL